MNAWRVMSDFGEYRGWTAKVREELKERISLEDLGQTQREFAEMDEANRRNLLNRCWDRGYQVIGLPPSRVGSVLARLSTVERVHTLMSAYRHAAAACRLLDYLVSIRVSPTVGYRQMLADAAESFDRMPVEDADLDPWEELFPG